MESFFLVRVDNKFHNTVKPVNKVRIKPGHRIKFTWEEAVQMAYGTFYPGVLKPESHQMTLAVCATLNPVKHFLAFSRNVPETERDIKNAKHESFAMIKQLNDKQKQ